MREAKVSLILLLPAPAITFVGAGSDATAMTTTGSLYGVGSFSSFKLSSVVIARLQAVAIRFPVLAPPYTAVGADIIRPPAGTPIVAHATCFAGAKPGRPGGRPLRNGMHCSVGVGVPDDPPTGTYTTASSPFSTVTFRVVPGRISPRRILRAMRVSTECCTYRRRGLAPYWGS